MQPQLSGRFWQDIAGPRSRSGKMSRPQVLKRPASQAIFTLLILARMYRKHLKKLLIFDIIDS
jgi:hypothetical protein